MKNSAAAISLVIAACVILFLAFKGPHDSLAVRTYSVPKPTAPETSDIIHQETAEAPAPVVWTTPNGWTEGEIKSGFQLANLQLQTTANSGRCTISVLGGGILPNLNRWRGQAGLAAFASEDDPGINHTDTFVWVEIRNVAKPEESFLGAIHIFGRRTVFTKLMIHSNDFESLTPVFLELCESIRVQATQAQTTEETGNE